MKRLTAAFGLLFCCLPAVAHALLGTGPGGVPTHGVITAPAADASLNPRGTWAANTVYAVGDSFLYNGTSYVVAAAFTSGSTFDATNLIQGVATNSAIAASNALTQAQAAYQNAPHFAVVNYGNAQTCTWTISHPDAAKGVVTYTGGVDDHAAMQAAFMRPRLLALHRRFPVARGLVPPTTTSRSLQSSSRMARSAAT